MRAEIFFITIILAKLLEDDIFLHSKLSEKINKPTKSPFNGIDKKARFSKSFITPCFSFPIAIYYSWISFKASRKADILD